MAVRVNTNTEAEFGRRILESNRKEVDTTLKRIASGLRINTASDDAAGLAISERLRSLTTGLEQSQSNLQDSSSALQVAEAGASVIGDSLQRIRELAVQASNDTLTDEDRAVIQEEVDQLVAEIDRQAGATQFNGQPLLTGQYASGNGSFQVQSGGNQGDTIDVNIAEVSTSSLGVSGIDVSTRDAANSALSTLDTAVSTLSSTRADLGASMNRISSASDYVGIARENILSALSQIRDADMAKESTTLALAQLRTQSGIAALSQSNVNPKSALSLLGV